MSAFPPHYGSTKIFFTNLHCASTIQEALSPLSPPNFYVDISTVSRTVTIFHSGSYDSQRAIKSTLEGAGLDVAEHLSPATSCGNTIRSSHSPLPKPTFLRSKTLDPVGQCSYCKRDENGYVDNRRQLVARQTSPICDTQSSTNCSNSINEREKEKPLTAVPSPGDVLSQGGPSCVKLFVGGMTCSACSSAVTRALSELSGVSDVVVSLLEKSATAIIDCKELADTVAEVVEDCGFESQVLSVESLDSKNEEQLGGTSRTISLRVHGMFCQQCTDQIMAALDIFGSKITIVKPLTAYTDPILELTYEPAPPSLSIRTIICAIASSKSSPLKVSIYRPMSLEEIARNRQIIERRGLLRRLIFAVAIAIPTFIIAVVFASLVKDNNPTKRFLMEPMWIGNASRMDWALLFLATPVMFYSAGIFHKRAIKEIRALWRRDRPTPILRRFTRFGSMNLLVSSGVSVAYFSSIALLALVASQPASPAGLGDNTTYFDSVVFLTVFTLAGRFLEAYSKERTADAITALSSLHPAEALLLVPRSPLDSTLTLSNGDIEKGDLKLEDSSLTLPVDSKLQKIDVDLLEVGDIVRVQNGSTPPCDGTIVSGEDSAFDESSLTGESRLIKKGVGDKVYMGTINKSKMVDVRVDAVGGGMMLDHIVKVVREGQTRRAPIERVADLITGYFVPVVTLLAISTWLIWLVLGLSGSIPSEYLDIPVGGWVVWSLEFAIAVFVVACPCGIGLAAPTALLVGSGLAAKFGILAHGGGEAFQEMAQLDLIVFDKTGTLTEGKEPSVSEAEFLADAKWERNVIMGIAAEIESASSHPLAIAIRNFCEGKGTPVTGSAFEETAGRGLKAYFESLHCTAIIGNESWMKEHGVIINKDIAYQLEVWKSEAKTLALLAIEDDEEVNDVTRESFHITAIFAVTDRVRPEAKDVVHSFQELGIATWMLSGDNATTAEAVAETVGIPKNNVIAGVLPHEKAQKIEWLQRVGTKRNASNWQSFFSGRMNERCIVAMVGDGINDAPALTAADIGIAMGSGSDVAISSASFILVSSHLHCLLTLSDLSRKVFNRVKINFLWAVCYNLIAVPVAAGVVYPVGHARLNPVWASLAMALSSVSVVCSSLHLRFYKEPRSRQSTLRSHR